MLFSASHLALQSGCLLNLFVFCILLSHRFRHLPLTLMGPGPSLSQNVSFRLGLVISQIPSYKCSSTHSPQLLSLLISGLYCDNMPCALYHTLFAVIKGGETLSGDLQMLCSALYMLDLVRGWTMHLCAYILRVWTGATIRGRLATCFIDSSKG